MKVDIWRDDWRWCKSISMGKIVNEMIIGYDYFDYLVTRLCSVFSFASDLNVKNELIQKNEFYWVGFIFDS